VERLEITEMGDSVGNSLVIPAKAGIHFAADRTTLDSRFCGNDDLKDSASCIYCDASIVMLNR
jgi:hypothetical protein